MTNQSFSCAFFVDRLKLVLTNPKGCWATIASDHRQPKELVIKLALPAAIIVAACNIIGVLVFGKSFGSGLTIHSELGDAFSDALVGIVFLVVMPFVYAFIAQKLSSFCNGSSDFSRAYSWELHATLVKVVGGVAMLFPPIGENVGFLCSLYSLYVAYFGIGEMLNVPQTQRLPFLALMLMLVMVLWVLMIGVLGVFDHHH